MNTASASDNDSFLLNLISNKLVDFRELVICLFDHCNLNCVFCPQDHNSVIGLSEAEILSKIPIIADYANQNKHDNLHFHIMGGELFQDQLISKGYIDIYQKFVDGLKGQISNSERIHFNFITNLVANDISALKNFCQRNKFKISISYDPSGRFNTESLKKFKANAELLKEHIRMVSCVITKPSINRVLKGDSTYDWLYNTFDVDWDPLLPSLPNSNELMPKESELLTFLKFLIDHYPKCINLENFLSPKSVQKMRCTRGKSLTVMPDNSIPLGCSGALFLKESKTANLVGQKIIGQFIDKYNCLSCEFYSKCSFTCFIKQDYKRLVDDVDGCVYKSVYQHVQNKKLSHTYENI